MRFTETDVPTIRTSAGVNAHLGVVFHHTAGAFDGAVHWLSTAPSSRVSAHVVIAKDGRRAILASDDAITWHAGASQFQGRNACNEFMLGVEFELTETDIAAGHRLTPMQIDSALEWLEARWDRYGWTIDWMTHHRAVARPAGQKRCLEPYNWDLLREAIVQRFIMAPAADGVMEVSVPAGTTKIVITIGR